MTGANDVYTRFYLAINVSCSWEIVWALRAPHTHTHTQTNAHTQTGVRLQCTPLLQVIKWVIMQPHSDWEQLLFLFGLQMITLDGANVPGIGSSQTNRRPRPALLHSEEGTLFWYNDHQYVGARQRNWCMCSIMLLGVSGGQQQVCFSASDLSCGPRRRPRNNLCGGQRRCPVLFCIFFFFFFF